VQASPRLGQVGPPSGPPVLELVLLDDEVELLIVPVVDELVALLVELLIVPVVDELVELLVELLIVPVVDELVVVPVLDVVVVVPVVEVVVPCWPPVLPVDPPPVPPVPVTFDPQAASRPAGTIAVARARRIGALRMARSSHRTGARGLAT
jgi:hypothetical protein